MFDIFSTQLASLSYFVIKFQSLCLFGPGLNPHMAKVVCVVSKVFKVVSKVVCVLEIWVVFEESGMMGEDWSLDSEGNRKRFRRSVSSISDGNDRDDRGWTLLHVGARKGYYKEVKRLLNEGMDANVAAFGPKSHGVTPLHLAAKGGHVKVMDKLLEYGANIDARTKGACGWTPLHTAAKEKNRRAIRFLVENGAFLPDNIEDTRFNPPVHYCHGLEWAYDEMKRVQQESGSSSSGEGSYSSDS